MSAMTLGVEEQVQLWRPQCAIEGDGTLLDAHKDSTEPSRITPYEKISCCQSVSLFGTRCTFSALPTRREFSEKLKMWGNQPQMLIRNL